MRHPSDKHYCPLLKRDVFWGGVGGCYEIQEVRDDNMDMELLPFEFSLDEANKVCEECRWCYVSEEE